MKLAEVPVQASREACLSRPIKPGLDKDFIKQAIGSAQMEYMYEIGGLLFSWDGRIGKHGAYTVRVHLNWPDTTLSPVNLPGISTTTKLSFMATTQTTTGVLLNAVEEK